mgnify:CR=1 FL=1
MPTSLQVYQTNDSPSPIVTFVHESPNHDGATHGVFTERPGTLSNDFFIHLLDMRTKWAPSAANEGVLRFDTDDQQVECGQRVRFQLDVTDAPPQSGLDLVAHGAGDAVARDLTEIFGQTESLRDVDNYMREPYDYWHFEVDNEKAQRRGISTEAINREL